MKSVKPSSETYATDTTIEQENQLIAEAKHLLYARLKTRDQVFTCNCRNDNKKCFVVCF